MREPRRYTFSPLSRGFDEGENAFQKEQVAYIAAKRIPRLAAVVSLAQMCAGGNQRAFQNKSTESATAFFPRDGEGGKRKEGKGRGRRGGEWGRGGGRGGGEARE